MKTLTLHAQGLRTANSNVVAGSPMQPGWLRRADNLVLNHEGLWEVRRGLFPFGSVGSIANDSLDYLSEFGNALFFHAKLSNSIWSYAPPAAPHLFSGTYNPPAGIVAGSPAAGFFRTVEASSNLYILSQQGVFRLDSPTGNPGAAGAPSGLNQQAALTSTDGTAIDGDCEVAYRCVFGTTDANGNLILGAPSGRTVLLSSSQLIPPGAMSVQSTLVTIRAPGNDLVDGENIVIEGTGSIISETSAAIGNSSSGFSYFTYPVASGSILTSMAAGQTILVQGVVSPATFTAVASGAGAFQFNIGATPSITAANLAASINAQVATVQINATSSGATVIFKGLLQGIIITSPSGGLIAFTTNHYRASITVNAGGATTPGDKIVLNGITFTSVAASPGPNQFIEDGTGAGTAANLATAVTNSTSPGVIGVFTASVVGGVVTLDAPSLQFPVVSVPSPDYSIQDGLLLVGSTGSNVANVLIKRTRRNSTLTIVQPLGLTTSHFCQIYRSIPSVSGNLNFPVDPGDNEQLVAQVPVTNPAAATLSFTDTIPYTQLGGALYTNATQQGIQQANAVPPYSFDVERFRNFTFYTCPARPPSLVVTLLNIDPSNNGLQIGDVISLPGGNVTAAAAENVGARQFKLCPFVAASDPSLQPSTFPVIQTVASIVNVINLNSAALGCTAQTLSLSATTPGGLVLVANAPFSQVSFAVSAHPNAWSPNSAQTVFPKQNLNVLAYSKYNQPDAVPILNTIPVGNANKSILRIKALRDALFIMKEDGVWRLTGTDPSSFDVQPYNLDLKLVAPNSVVTISNTLIGLFNQGLCHFSDSNHEIISLDIDDQIQALLTPAMAPVTRQLSWAYAYETERQYVLYVPSASTDTIPTNSFIYSTVRGQWTGPVTKNFRYGVVRQFNNSFWAVNGLNIWTERKDGLNTDYADELITSSMTIQSYVTPITNGISTVRVNSVGTIAQGDTISQGSNWATVLNVDAGNNILTVDRQQNWTTAVANVSAYRAIPVQLQWSPNFGTDPGIAHHWREASVFFKRTAFAQCFMAYNSDRSTLDDYVELLASNYGLVRGAQQPITLRSSVPLEKHRGQELNITFKHANAWFGPIIQGMEVVFEDCSERTGR